MNKSNTKAIRKHELSEILQKDHYINYNMHTIFKAVSKKTLNNYFSAFISPRGLIQNLLTFSSLDHS